MAVDENGTEDGVIGWTEAPSTAGITISDGA